jgi:hypothetical protein
MSCPNLWEAYAGELYIGLYLRAPQYKGCPDDYFPQKGNLQYLITATLVPEHPAFQY